LERKANIYRHPCTDNDSSGIASPHYSRKLTSRRIFCRCETMHDERRIWI